MLFNYRLRTVADILPFGDSTLHWFGLTDGWFWMCVGEHELFRYSSRFQGAWSGRASEPYVDYYIARLWEDLLDMLPTILDPLPVAVAERVSPFGEWKDWCSRVKGRIEGSEDEAAFDLRCQAVEWWSSRQLDTGYLAHAPGIWLWRVDDMINIRWDNSHAVHSDVAVWHATSGEISMQITDFLQEVHGFHDRFMESMAQRVEQVCHRWSRPDIQIDLVSLVREQQDREKWLDRTLNKPPEKHNWATVVEAMAALDALVAGG